MTLSRVAQRQGHPKLLANTIYHAALSLGRDVLFVILAI